MGILAFLLGFDLMGHNITINFKGNNKHPTKLGAFFSIGIIVLSTIYLVERSISLV